MKGKIFAILAVFALALAAIPGTMAQEVETEKFTYAVGEEITFVITNTGDTDIGANYICSLSERITIQKLGGEIVYSVSPHPEYVCYMALILHPGDSITWSWDQTYHTITYALSEKDPGTWVQVKGSKNGQQVPTGVYKFTVQFDDGVSASCIFRIAENVPQGGQAAKANIEKGQVDVDTHIVCGIPYCGGKATYTRKISVGEIPAFYRFEWTTTIDQGLYYELEWNIEASAEQTVYEVCTIHLWMVPEYIPAGTYKTTVKVYACYADGSENLAAKGSDSFYYKGSGELSPIEPIKLPIDVPIDRMPILLKTQVGNKIILGRATPAQYEARIGDTVGIVK